MSDLEKPWEKVLGSDSYERVKRIGNESIEFKTKNNLRSQDEILQQRFNNYIHSAGADILQLQLSDTKKLELEREEYRKKSHAVGRILRKKVIVESMEEGIISITMDQDWDTSSWNAEMIEAGCDALLLIFYHPDSTAVMDRKERAVLMLQKLIARHNVAENFIRRNIEMMIGKAANRLIRNGKSAGLLDLLYVLHGCREKFYDDLSRFNFTGRAHEMLLLESRLAAILIQHAYRVRLDRLRPKPRPKYSEGFGDPAELDRLRDSVVKNRTRDLRNMWRSMHCNLRAKERQVIGGLRGPVHVGEEYTKLAMEIILQLVCEKSLERAPGNREDVVRANGCIILSNFLASPSGPYANLAVQVLMNVSKAAESFNAMLHTQTPYSCYKYLVLMKSRLDRFKGNIWTDKTSRFYKEANALKHLFIDALSLLTKMGIHASGIYRARNLYAYKIDARPDSEAVDYLALLQSNRRNLETEHIIKLLALPDLFRLLSVLILECKQITIMRYLLRCFYSLSTSECYRQCFTEIVAYGGAFMNKLLDMLEEQDIVVSTLCMCIMIQMCTQDSGRSGLFVTNIPRSLAPLTKSTTNYSRRPYLRAILVTASLIRVSEWRSYEPQDTPVTFANEEFIRKSVYLDLLKTMKNVPVQTADRMTIADLVVMPTDFQASLEMSKQAEAANPKDLADFLGHPHDRCHYESLPYDESCGGCVILEGLSMHPGTALSMFDAGIVFYLGQCLFQSRFLFLGKPMSEGQLMIILNGVASAANALANLALASIGHQNNIDEIIEGVNRSNLMGSSCFFINTLSVSHPSLDPGLSNLQVHVGMSVIRFFDAYAAMILSMQTTVTNSDGTVSDETDSRVLQLLTSLSDAGEAVSHLIESLPKVHGKSPHMVTMLDQMCTLLEKLTVPRPGADSAVNSWKIFEALRAHLPHSLSAIGELGADDPLFREGLDRMPPSLFLLLANLCQVERGKALTLSDGFLRRGLEKMHLERPKLESDSVMETWKTLKRLNKPLPLASKARQGAIATLKLVSRIAGFNHKQYGSSNDVIFLSNFRVIAMCIEFIGQSDCPRDDLLVLYSVQAIYRLSFDDTRSYFDLERADIFEVVRRELSRFDEYPLTALRDYIVTLTNFTTGYRSPYSVQRGGIVREILAKLIRFRSGLEKVIQDCNWSITKTSMGSGSVYVVADELDEFIRTGHKSSGVISANNDASTMTNDAKKMYKAHSSSIYLDDSKVDQDPDDDYRSLQSTLAKSSESLTINQGTYMSCGVSSCGSLHQSGHHSHGELGHVDYRDLHLQLKQRKDSYSDGRAEVSKLSARDRDLQQRIENYKVSYGYREKEPMQLMSPIKSNANSKMMMMAQHASSTSLVDSSLSSYSLPKIHSVPTSPVVSKRHQSAHSAKKALFSPSPNKPMSKSMVSMSMPSLPSPMKSIDLQDCPELRMTKPSSIVVIGNK